MKMNWRIQIPESMKEGYCYQPIKPSDVKAEFRHIVIHWKMELRMDI